MIYVVLFIVAALAAAWAMHGDAGYGIVDRIAMPPIVGYCVAAIVWVGAKVASFL